MTDILPSLFLFRYSLPIRAIAKLPRKGKQLLGLPQNCTLSNFAELDHAASFGQVRAAWNPQGIGLSVEVHGKRQRARCDPQKPLESDGLHVWIDTRSTPNAHRASRFCHQFYALPSGSGPAKDQPSARQLPIARAREEAPLAKPGDLAVSTAEFADGYLLELWLPAKVLHGFEPETNPRLGFYYALRDSELGEQYLGVGPEFPFSHDPSLWWTAELT